MASQTVINTILLFFFSTNFAAALVEVDVSGISISFGSSINNFLPNCFGVELEFFLQLSTSNYSSQTTYFIPQQDANSNNIQLANTSTFQIPSPTDFISLTGILSMRCSVSLGPFTDSFLIQSQNSKLPDGNNVQVTTQVQSNVNSWILQATLIRKCTGTSQYGFNCNEVCSDTKDDYYCYTCGSNGQKTCCNSLDVNPNDCSYYNQPASTTWSPDSCSAAAETTYFWLMISFAIIIVILAIFLLLAFLELCCGIFTQQRSAKRSEDGEWIVGNEPKANRELYDGDIYRKQQYRKNGDPRHANEPEDSRRSPYFVNREGLDNQTFDEESLRNQWVEPQPRRIARV